MDISVQNDLKSKERLALVFLGALGGLVWLIVLLRINIADTDLWAKMAIGALLAQNGSLLTQDIFAFTPVLPHYVDHEWGSGLMFFEALHVFGPPGLMLLKIALATGALLAAVCVARKQASSWPILLLLLPFAAWALAPGYAVIIRSHAFTFALFAATVLLLEKMRSGSLWPGFLLALIIMAWTNLHGGFVAGLGMISVYAGWSCLERKHWKAMVITAIGCWFATLVNPNGYKYWQILVPALIHPRREITEWQPLPLFGSDVFVGFRVLFLIMIVSVVGGWRHVQKRSWPGLIMLALTAYLGWKSRRHAPFFAVTALAIGTPYLEAALKHWFAAVFLPDSRRMILRIAALGVVYVGLAVWAFTRLLPHTTFQILAPIGIYPVIEVDVLDRSGVAGNAAVPFNHGSYVSWRLHPRIKVSMDGRYEAVYPESSFQLNQDFFGKRGPDWDRLIRNFPVDFVILDYASGKLRPEDLTPKGYVLIWLQKDVSALMALEKHAPGLRQTVMNLPRTTIDPLSAEIPRKWPKLTGTTP